ncbi:hypothetical protein [Deferribacter abyssi]|uniref:hypothetical protein n=1 Tax=Deferribacter abyssi TaxID=213806 RepID=UPI003C219765
MLKQYFNILETNFPIMAIGDNFDYFYQNPDAVVKCIIAPQFILAKSIEENIKNDSNIVEFGDTSGIFVNGIFVDKYFVNLGIDEKFLNQPVGTDSKVWCQLSGNFELLPWLPFLFKISPTNPDDTSYYEVLITDETTLGDVIKNSWRYTFSLENNVYEKLSDTNAWRNFKRAYMYNEVYKYNGNVQSKFADYSRVLSFILQKLKANNLLSLEEESVLSAFLERLIDNDSLMRINQREQKINDLLAWYKTD